MKENMFFPEEFESMKRAHRIPIPHDTYTEIEESK